MSTEGERFYRRFEAWRVPAMMPEGGHFKPAIFRSGAPDPDPDPEDGDGDD